METLVIHIAFFYKEKRLEYIHRIIDESHKYPFSNIDIFIHTNQHFTTENVVTEYDNVTVSVIVHTLEHPFALTWLCRDIMFRQRETYHAFMYIEDDILVPKEAVDYWKELSPLLKKFNYNLGFVRIETKEGTEYITDLAHGRVFSDFVVIDDTHRCALNNINPYCAFWIYSKEDFHDFISSQYYDVNNIYDYGLRERCAIGLHGLGMNFYHGTLLPLRNNGLDPRCRIYHLPNNYAIDADSPFAKIRFNDCCLK